MAFFLAASEAAGRATEYTELTAGLMALRLVDKLKKPRSNQPSPSRKEILAVRRLIESLPDGPVREALDDLVSTLGGTISGAASDRIAAVMMYAGVLEREGRWAVSADTYQTAIDLITNERRRREDLPLCYQRAGYCFRELGMIDKAEALFAAGMGVADARKDVEWQLRLRISQAHLELHRGNIPAAERHLDQIIAEAAKFSLPLVVARAKHDRGHVAYTRQEYEQAAEFFHCAIEMYGDPSLRLRAMHDLATVLCDLHQLSLAERLLWIVRRSAAANALVRSMAGLNLLRLAVLQGSSKKFEAMRGELLRDTIADRLRPHLHFITSQGLQVFGAPDAARDELTKAIALARTYRIHQLEVEAEASLEHFYESRCAVPESQPELPIIGIIEQAIADRRGAFAEATS